MTYTANIIPTLEQLASGELEPVSPTFRAAVAAYRTAIWHGVWIALVFQWADMLAFSNTGADTFAGFTTQAAAFAFIQAAWSSWYIRFKRKPSVAQIEHLTNLVSEDPSIAHKVARFEDKDFTFFKMQQFIMKNSAKSNEMRLESALDDLDDAVHGKQNGAA